jgi:hypothetical protein
VSIKILDDDPEIQIPELVATPHQIDRQYHEATESGARGDVSEESTPNARRHVLDHADRVGTVKGRLEG